MSPISLVTARSLATVSMSFALLGSRAILGVMPVWSPCRSIALPGCAYGGARDVEAAIAALYLRSAPSFSDVMVPGGPRRSAL